jgi:drug/metabolite transporter (DMT)-like permease
MLISLAIAVRIVANPLSNALQKLLTQHGAGPLAVVGFTYGLLSLCCLPLLLISSTPGSFDFWWNIAISTTLAVVGNVLIVHALRLADLSVLGPVNAYKSVISLLPGALLLGEYPRPLGICGIGLIVLGSYLIADSTPRKPGVSRMGRLLRDPGVQYRVAALVFAGIEAVYLKRALLASTPFVAFAWWSLLGLVVTLAVAPLLVSRAELACEIATFRCRHRSYLLLALTTGLMQFCTLVTFVEVQVGYALALFQTSTLLSVVLGYQVFKEPNFVRRMLAAVVMAVGAVLILLAK